ncbi:hypothetical protein AHMF7605_28185 [Adhaeribacter arboris]|uniref:Thioredoxin domain-containing protein n=1 Tax=Adhaeribacter arboris TaxID=2072846 RepID=A0A2T2YNJ5_9BACT|nr:redoxin domain-containing protein [Adhaeribacter arboris]PSR57083.1 hypothetical protein AHMF7605_28185 [Adhaeribacter arboris]
MNKGLLISVLLAVIVLGAWFIMRSGEPQVEQDISSTQATTSVASSPPAPVNDLPNLPLTKPDQTKFNAKDLKGKTVLIFFEPDCEHCQREANEMQKHLPAFAKYSVYFFSPAPFDQMQQFFMKYNLSGPNISYAQTPFNIILQELGAIPAPSVYIYSEQGKLIKAFKGETPMANILPLL